MNARRRWKRDLLSPSNRGVLDARRLWKIVRNDLEKSRLWTTRRPDTWTTSATVWRSILKRGFSIFEALMRDTRRPTRVSHFVSADLNQIRKNASHSASPFILTDDEIRGIWLHGDLSKNCPFGFGEPRRPDVWWTIVGSSNWQSRQKTGNREIRGSHVQ